MAEGTGTDLAAVERAYGAWAPAYIERFGAAEKAPAEDVARIATWADGLAGPVLDAGCGPGHWSAFLHALGLEVEGVDATPELLAHAARTRPDIPFRRADLRRLDLPAGSLGGVLAWFSLIHLEPDEVRAVLRDLAAALRPGGGLLLGGFAGPVLERFDHRVVTAWAWPTDELADAISGAGLEVVDRTEQEQPSGRVFATLSARRPA